MGDSSKQRGSAASMLRARLKAMNITSAAAQTKPPAFPARYREKVKKRVKEERHAYLSPQEAQENAAKNSSLDGRGSSRPLRRGSIGHEDHPRTTGGRRRTRSKKSSSYGVESPT